MSASFQIAAILRSLTVSPERILLVPQCRKDNLRHSDPCTVGTQLVNRRDVLVTGGLLAACGISASQRASKVLANEAAVHRTLPQPPGLGADQVIFVDREDSAAQRYAASYNLRTIRTPKLRALCKTPQSVAAMVEWAREHSIPFALRSGGHCFEGFSQNTELIIDTRLLNTVVYDNADQTVIVGAGALLSDIYRFLAREGRTIPAGICQSVGIAGLVLGGGVGYLARSAGLTCDALEQLEIVDAEGRRNSVHAGSQADLFWACRGGGGGSFGAATAFHIKTVAAPDVLVFEVDWVLNTATAADLMAAWQSAGPEAPDEISTIVSLRKRTKDTVLIRMVGQSVGTEQQLKTWVKPLLSQAKPWSQPRLHRHAFIDAANYFSPPAGAAGGYYKFKSDIVTSPLPRDALVALIEPLQSAPPGALNLECEALGGAISQVPVSDTAFPYRNGALFKIQYSTEVQKAKNTTGYLLALSSQYEAMRPFMSGAAYVNYCDRDLEDWPRAYWQSNLERLKNVKRKYDPHNIFQHDQSVPLK